MSQPDLKPIGSCPLFPEQSPKLLSWFIKAFMPLSPSSFLGSSLSSLPRTLWSKHHIMFLSPSSMHYVLSVLGSYSNCSAWHISLPHQQLSLSLDFLSFGTFSESHTHVTCVLITLHFVFEGFLPTWLLLICLSSLLYCKLCEFTESPECPQYRFIGRFLIMNH